MKNSNLPKKLESIKFSLLSPKEIRKMSATKIITADTYNDDGFPFDMGLMDSRLGVIEPGLRCKTCGKKVDECPGHFGNIELAMPVIHIGFTNMIKMLLRATCQKCGRLVLPIQRILEFKEELKRFREMGRDPLDMSEIWDKVAKTAAKNKTCPNCGEAQEKITLDKPTTFRKETHKLTPKEIREWLEKIPDDDLIPLGINYKDARPEWTILTVLPVPPVTVRPSITLDSGERSEDDLTHKLVDVIRINRRLQDNRDAGAPQLIIEDLWELLQYHITTYFDNQTAGIPPARHRSGRPLKTLSLRLKGKEGRFRSNLSGKRVNFSARTVITPDPFLSLNEVGVPIKAARELTVPVRVTKFNVERMRELIIKVPEEKDENDIKSYKPCVSYLIRPDGRRIKISEKNAAEWAENLQPGFKVERHLQDGDIVLFNRQPSLHRMSMMGHEVRVMPNKTFRFNLCACPPYNADFDGDEMNLHVLQSEEAQAEAKILMRVQEHILSPRFGGNVMGAIHDHITGSFLLTYRNPKFTRDQALEILGNTGSIKTLPDPEKETWYGKEIFSQILSGDLNMTFQSSICQKCDTCLKNECPHDSYVIIRNGELLAGTIDGKAIGAFGGKILDKIIRTRGHEEGRIFLDNATKLAIGTIMVRGFTTSIDDEDIPEEAILKINSELEEAEEKVNQTVEAFKSGNLDPYPGRSVRETLEVKSMEILGRARDTAGKIAGKHLGLDNSAVIMAQSGARGSMLNLSQMAGSIGQQAVRGERIKRGYRRRTLSHFRQDDLGAKARGFVKASFKSGLSPTEYFFHSMGGREGLVDTAVRTSRSGYMQRRLINALEDLHIEYDRSVRNTATEIIQFSYGEDGVDPTRSFYGEAVDIEGIVNSVLSEEEKRKAGKEKKSSRKKRPSTKKKSESTS